MGYFANFPSHRRYVGGREVVGINLAKRSIIPRSYFNDSAYYMEYDVEDGETPVMIADRFYDDADLYWIVMAFNQISDVDDQWPLTTHEFDEYVGWVYGGSLYSIHHYESAETGAQVPSDWPEYDRVPITNWDHEYRENEAKRHIKLLLPQYADSVVAQNKEFLRKRYRAL